MTVSVISSSDGSARVESSLLFMVAYSEAALIIALVVFCSVFTTVEKKISTISCPLKYLFIISAADKICTLWLYPIYITPFWYRPIFISIQVQAIFSSWPKVVVVNNLNLYPSEFWVGKFLGALWSTFDIESLLIFVLFPFSNAYYIIQ